ncbi:uncharacterized protein LOC118598811 [Tachysurus ichikawai]
MFCEDLWPVGIPEEQQHVFIVASPGIFVPPRETTVTESHRELSPSGLWSHSEPTPTLHPLYTIVYIDDILVYSPTMEKHVNHVLTVIMCMIEHHLWVNEEKCEFQQNTILFLVYIISHQGVKIDPGKV